MCVLLVRRSTFLRNISNVPSFFFNMKLSLLNLESIHKLISSSPSKKYSESFFLLSSLQKNLKDSSVWTDEQEDLFESEALVVL